ncbi:MAG: hypothetical protein R2881_04050 [Eubacteriales bacterium]
MLLYPHLKNKIRHIYLMGGGIDFGNWTPQRSLTSSSIRDTADIVFQSGSLTDGDSRHRKSAGVPGRL